MQDTRILPDQEQWNAARRSMVAHQVVGRGIRSTAVAHAMAEVPREAFVPAAQRRLAYDDTPLPIGAGQTISQPYIVAYMLEALELTGGERALEIGTGSGYAAAVLGRIAREVYTIERHPALAAVARDALAALGFVNVHVVCGDGTKGWVEAAPYDVIVVAAGGPPEIPSTLKGQLAVGGRMVIPIGATPLEQHLVRVRRTGEQGFRDEALLDVRFVPLIGAEGWAEESDR